MEMINNDHEIVQALLQHNERITRDFFYRRCYPLFKSVYDNYYTDCSSCVEFINEIYVHIMMPNSENGLCKLATFQFQSTLFTWLKTVCLYYCYKKYGRKNNVYEEHICEKYDEGSAGVRIDNVSGSIFVEDSLLYRHDIEVILRLMPNRRYAHLIRLKYLEGHTNEETAQLMGMNMNTFYNKHKMSKEQYLKILRKEELSHGKKYDDNIL